MSAPKHTPGPWRCAVRSNQHGPQMVAVDMPPHGAWKPTRNRLTDEDVANARLIAAAPDLYALAKAFGDETISDSEFNAMRSAVLAKIEVTP